jgi:hypothetical protein
MLTILKNKQLNNLSNYIKGIVVNFILNLKHPFTSIKQCLITPIATDMATSNPLDRKLNYLV